MTQASDAERIVAHLYSRSGRSRLSENDLANALSLDLKWFQPSAARAVVAALAREGYLQRDDDGELRPAFDTKAVAVPLSFRPAPDLAHKIEPRRTPPTTPIASPPSAVAASPTQGATPPAAAPPKTAPAQGSPKSPPPAPAPFDLGALLEALAVASGEDVADWVGRMDAVIQASEDQLTPEVALLLAGAREGVDVAPFLGAARSRLVVARQGA